MCCYCHCPQGCLLPFSFRYYLVCTEIQPISVVSVKFVPCYRTEFPEFCSLLFCFLLVEGRHQHFLCRELSQLESFLCCRKILRSFFHAFIMVKNSSAWMNECNEHTSIRGRYMQYLVVFSFLPLHLSQSSRKGKTKPGPVWPQLS